MVDRSPVPARFLERLSRFVVVAELVDGSRVRAYLPNTGRLLHLAEPGRPMILRRDGTPPRVTEYTATRIWDGCWVGLEASSAPALLTEWLTTHDLPGFGFVKSWKREIAVGGHRLDLVADTELGRVWIEVKSGGRTHHGTALLSKTPSARGIAHLRTLESLVTQGELAAAVFVFQRPDAERLFVGGDAEPGWVQAVIEAHRTGVSILAFGCEVTPRDVHVERPLPVEWDHPAG